MYPTLIGILKIIFLSSKVNGFQCLDDAIDLTVLKASKTIKPNK